MAGDYRKRGKALATYATKRVAAVEFIFTENKMGSSFLSKIKYKKERVGVVEKDGKTYIKYVKARRFRMSRNLKHAVLSLFILVVLGVGIKLLLSELASKEAVEETHAGIGS